MLEGNPPSSWLTAEILRTGSWPSAEEIRQHLSCHSLEFSFWQTSKPAKISIFKFREGLKRETNAAGIRYRLLLYGLFLYTMMAMVFFFHPAEWVRRVCDPS